MKSLTVGCVLCALLPQWWWLGRVWGHVPEDAQLGLGTGRSTQIWSSGWMLPDRVLSLHRDPLLLSGPCTLEGGIWTLPFLIRTENTFVLMEVYRNIITNLKKKGSNTKKFATTNYTPPPPFLEKDFADSFWEFGIFKARATHLLSRPSIKLSLFQTPMFWYHSASLCIWH